MKTTGGEMKHDANSVRPTSINHLIGQNHVRQVVMTALDAAFQDGHRFDHALMVGPPGMGKTATAQVIAHEMATEFIELLGQSIKNIGDLNAALLLATDKAIIFIDEVHELDKTLQTALYLALDQQMIMVPSRGHGSVPFHMPVADFTLLMATTDEHRLLQPLRDRMKLILHFDFYAPEDLEQIVRQRSRGLSWIIEDEVFPAIAQRSRGTARLALRLLDSARRVARSLGEGVITTSHLERACTLDQIDELGLGAVDQKYLRLLDEMPRRLNVLASMLGLPSRTVAGVIEPYLIRAKLIMKDDQERRLLTPFGHEHLSVSRPEVV
jgi:Holliday junction DNA helicase RuvB